MGKRILKVEHEDLNVPHYGVYSTIVDAPVTPLEDVFAFTRRIEHEQGIEGLRKLPRRLENAWLHGCSNTMSLDEAVFLNRYGENESQLSVEAFIKKWIAESR